MSAVWYTRCEKWVAKPYEYRYNRKHESGTRSSENVCSRSGPLKFRNWAFNLIIYETRLGKNTSREGYKYTSPRPKTNRNPGQNAQAWPQNVSLGTKGDGRLSKCGAWRSFCLGLPERPDPLIEIASSTALLSAQFARGLSDRHKFSLDDLIAVVVFFFFCIIQVTILCLLHPQRSSFNPVTQFEVQYR